ncbi:MAG: ABC transporter ATP-binding protein [Gemmatimonadales bacterium]
MTVRTGVTDAVRMRGIMKRFGPTEALRGVDFALAPGEVHALLGENGAGKTTLMHVLFGLLRADAGSVEVNGRLLPGGSPREAMAVGLGMVHQHFSQVPRMTVAENVWLGREGVRYRRTDAEAAVRRVAAATGLDLDPAAMAGDLPVGLRQRLEIVKGLAREVRVLILDEPTAALTPGETDELFVALRRLVGTGMSIVLITHKLREVAAIADRVTILRRGAVVLSEPANGLGPEDLARAMIGEDAAPEQVAVVLETRALGGDARAGQVALRVSGLGVRGAHGRPDPVKDVSFEVRAGEIVGIAAVEGNGQRELMRAVAGIVPHVGEVALAPGGVGFVPEDRQAEALIADFSIVDNMALGRSAGFWLDRGAAARAAQDAIAEFRIQVRGHESPARTLSGGNQQKVVLARVLGGAPALLVAENPTRGLDIRSAADVHACLRRAARERGLGVLFHSTDLDETIALADRMAVMVGGRWTWVSDTARTRAAVGALMLGNAA